MTFAMFLNTDVKYIYPTLQFIQSLRVYIPRTDLIPYVAIEHGYDFDLALLDTIADRFGIVFIPVDGDKIDADREGPWRDHRIPPITLLKFSIFDILPAGVNRVLYVDPDTMLVGHPRRLLEFRPRPGTIGVVEDGLAFYVDDWSANGAAARAYLTSLSLDRSDGYFNAGLISFDRSTWKDIARDAMQYLSENRDICVHHDQSALNAVLRRRKASLSPIWNFQTRFRFWGKVAGLEPVILHFTGAEKAWLGPFEPWSDMYDMMLGIAAQIEPLGLSRPRVSTAAVAAHNAGFSGMGHTLRRTLDWRLRARRARLAELHSDAEC